MGQIVVERLFTAIVLNRPTDEKTVAAGIPKAESQGSRAHQGRRQSSPAISRA